MITKRIPKSSEHPDDFNRLARYIAAAEDPGEKLHDFWIGNTGAAERLEDLETALLDIEAVRKMKPGVNDKTYHFIVSFRPGEEDQLSGDDLRTIAGRFVDEMGFRGHQYVAGAHENTDNFHMHVAVNRVHPETFRIHTPHHDFRVMARVSRELETTFGLSQDRGMTDEDWLPGKSGHKAQDFERHTWQQSFQSYVIENKTDILAAIDMARNWEQVHRTLEAGWAITLKPRGNGLVFANRDNLKQSMKASALDRSCSRKALEARLGPYRAQGVAVGHKIEPDARKSGLPPGGKRYEAKPLLFKHPSIGPLWRRFLTTGKTAHKRSTMLGRAAGNWKLWLMTEAYEDPLAMVILIAYQEAMRSILGPTDRQRRVPKEIELQLAAWRQQTTWSNPPARADQIGAREPSIKDTEGNRIAPLRDDMQNIIGLMVLDPKGRAFTVGKARLKRQYQKKHGKRPDRDPQLEP